MDLINGGAYGEATRIFEYAFPKKLHDEIARIEMSVGSRIRYGCISYHSFLSNDVS
jgi:hypothetical protein